ncbi:MAG: asparagine synthase (glutamine-hydrolyzing) [Sphingobacteriales bacterium]|nr:asparagine synthase (glutamine-hydrolyzing) [Sphingobacteriales bacterium]
MCGIAGFISSGYNEAQLREITTKLKHRGPDAEGFYFNQHAGFNIGLGHRRLSIIDLSAAASQPMHSHNGRYTMIFNGEIYNYQELRDSKLSGKSWRSTSDSEVIVECFAQYGTACFGWLNGMFAIAIWDNEEKKLTLARDHVGIKPLYCYFDDGELIFASELKSIKTIKKNLAVNYSVIPAYLHLGYIPHPFSVYENTNKLSAGSFAEITISSSGSLLFQEGSFWKIQDKIQSQVLTDEKNAKTELDVLLSDAVNKQLISDVPIGTFLSGGTDSSLVTALASKVSAKKINTYSIAVTDGKVNEAPFAAAIARHLDTNHHELPISQKEMLEMVPGFMNVYDEPFTDSSAFPTMLVSKLARQHVTVTLSGDGGDELFGGYGSYLWARRLQNPLLKLSAPLIYTGTRWMNSRYQRAGMMFDKYPSGHFKSHLFSQSQYFFSEKEIKKLLINPAFNFEEINYEFTGRKLNSFENMSFWDIENYLKDDLLVKVDRASMKYSLETRVPLLDYRVVEFALNLSSCMKITKQGTMKYLLKEVLYNYVPKQLLDRPKWGFSIPLVKWLKTDLKWMIDKYCSKEVIENAGIVHFEQVRKLLSRYNSGKADYLYNRIWTLIVLHWFFNEQH